MKKTILSIVFISTLVALNGCSEPGPKRTYTADQRAYMCGYWEVVLTGRSETKYGVIESGRDSFGQLTFKGISQKIASKMTIYNGSKRPDNTYLLQDGTFSKRIPVDTNGRKRPSERWSFRQQKNGKYFFGFTPYPNTKNVLGLDGKWCERIH